MTMQRYNNESLWVEKLRSRYSEACVAEWHIAPGQAPAERIRELALANAVVELHWRDDGVTEVFFAGGEQERVLAYADAFKRGIAEAVGSG